MKGTSLILPIFMLLGPLSAYLFLHLSVLDFCVQIFSFFSMSSCYLFLGDFLTLYCCVYASITLWPYACVPALLFLWVSPFTFGLHLCFISAAFHTSLYLCVCLCVLVDWQKFVFSISMPVSMQPSAYMTLFSSLTFFFCVSFYVAFSTFIWFQFVTNNLSFMIYMVLYLLIRN